jgi:hypothetical protein
MASVSERVRAMDEFQVVRCFEAFSQQLIAGSRTPLDTMKKGVPASIRSLTEWQRVENLTPKQAEQALEPTQAAETARNILMKLADDPTFSPLLDRFLTSYRDDELVADIIMAVGLVASMILMIASTEAEGEIAGVKFKKHKVDPAMIKALFEPFAKSLVGQIKKSP